MMQTATRSWEELRSSARTAEHTLEDKIAAYTAISRAQARSSAPVYDEAENPPEEAADERSIAVDIENALASLSDTIDEMNVVVNKTSVKTQDAMLQRYREVYFDFNTEFRRSMSTQWPFGRRRDGLMLNERRAVDSSRSMTSSIIEQAMATKNALENQRRQFTSSHGKVATLGNSFAGINTLVEQIRRKKPEDIRKEFERYGEVRDVYIPKDYYTKEPKGFAFVEFRSEREAEDARRSLDGVRIDGRDIRVVFAQERRKSTDQMRERESI
ncbi:Golgi SNAP receptor complex, subunit 1 [Phytophthora cactorum]|nr:Golgi SNAP receptor complex, subunit 1 [Phytophthora cactorum]